MMKNSDAARRFAERRKREDDAPRLIEEIPDLVDLQLQISERRAESRQSDTTHLRRVVVASAPAHFEIPCGDPSCQEGGHDLTAGIMRQLHDHETTFEGEDVCYGSVRTSNCGRILHYVATAKYKE